MPVNVFDLAGYIPNLFEYEPLNIFGSIDTILSEKLENDWNNPIFHAEPESPKPWVEYYRQSAINGELLTIDDPVFKNHWKEYHSWADEWECCCKESDKTEWCYCEDKNHRQNAASGRFYLSSDGATLRYINHYGFIYNNDSITKPYRAIYAHALLYILAR